MTADVSLKCSCGAVTGTAHLTPVGRRLVCLCRSCQAYARFLGRQDEILDANGGTDVYQLTPSQLRITGGADQLRCVRVSSKGPLRWYTECCKTPIGNTLPNPRVAFVGVLHMFMDHAADGQSRDEALGPIAVRVNARHAIGHVEGGHPSAPASMMFGFMFSLLFNWIAGRNKPTPFFDDAGEPIVTPLVLDQEQRAAIGLKPRAS